MTPPDPSDVLTRDLFLGGNIVLHQPRDGYRFSIDAVILAHWADVRQGDRVVDLGTGCGVIPIMMAFRHTDISLIGVEIQASLAALARRNIADNGMGERIHVVEKDMGRLSLKDTGGPVDLVVSNPPYRQRGSGRLNADRQRALARHELAVDLQSLVRTARRMLRKAGRFGIIYPSVRTVDLLAAMRASDLEPKTLTPIHARMGSPAQLVAVMGTRGGRPGLDFTAPLTLYRDDGTYTPRLEAMLGG